ncbi:hypothetical protein DV736_g5153, partial [Chaetothyriales sp. CBS 134916]
MALAAEPTPVADEAFQLEEGEEADFTPLGAQPADTAAIIPEIYNEKPEEEAQWWKIHLRGTDDLSTDDLLALVHHYAPGADVHIQWVNDTAANVVCKGSDNMQNIFLNLVDADLVWPAVVADPFALHMARQHPSNPATMLQMRVAQAGDRKKKNAAVESRYYLLHPGDDPTERIRQEFNSNRGEYRRRRADDRDQRRRRDADLAAATNEFSASMYDDAPSTADQQTTTQSRGRDLFSRITRRRSASPRPRNASEIDISDSEHESRPRTRRNGYRDRTQHATVSPAQNAGKELFSSDDTPRGGGGLRSDNLNLFPIPTLLGNSTNNNTHPGANGARPAADSRAENAAVAKRLKADLLSAAQTSPRSNHRRSHAMDAKNEEDLAERFARKTLSIDSTRSHCSANSHSQTHNHSNPTRADQGLLIRGGATSSSNGAPELSIKGRAIEAKELFPHLYVSRKRSAGGGGPGGNEGKELFDEPIREKRVRRRAELPTRSSPNLDADEMNERFTRTLPSTSTTVYKSINKDFSAAILVA